jgi:hypothetical protein
MRTAVTLLIILLVLYVLFSGRGVKVWQAITS